MALNLHQSFDLTYPVVESIAAGPAEYGVVEQKIDPANPNIKPAINFGTPAPKAIDKNPAKSAEIWVVILGKM